MATTDWDNFDERDLLLSRLRSIETGLTVIEGGLKIALNASLFLRSSVAEARAQVEATATAKLFPKAGGRGNVR